MNEALHGTSYAPDKSGWGGYHATGFSDLVLNTPGIVSLYQHLRGQPIVRKRTQLTRTGSREWHESAGDVALGQVYRQITGGDPASLEPATEAEIRFLCDVIRKEAEDVIRGV